LVKRCVGWFAGAFEINQQVKRLSIAIDATAVGLNPLAQRLEIELIKGLGWVDLALRVCDNKLTVDQKNISLHARETMVESIEQGTFMQIVIVCVRLWERLYRGSCPNVEQDKQQSASI
jgi:hypothetical protein